MTDEPTLNLQPLPGSDRSAVPGGQPGGQLDPATVVSLTLVLRRRGELPEQVSAGREVLDRARLAEVAGADPADLELVSRVLTGLGLQIQSSDLATRLVRVAGPIGRLAQVFGTRLELVRSPHPESGELAPHRHRTGELSVPAELGRVVVAVLGLDDRPQARAHFRWAPGATASVS